MAAINYFYYNRKNISDCMKKGEVWEMHYNFEDNKGVIRIRKLRKNRQYNGQKKKDKQRSTKHIHTTKDRVTRTPLKPGMISCAPISL